MNIEFYLPYPPTVNNYYVKTARGIFISQKGRKYRDDLHEATHQQIGEPQLDGRLSVQIILHPPDKRKRDLDNVGKSLLDALTKAKVWEDDEQIDQLQFYRGKPVKPGLVWMRITEAGPMIPQGMTIPVES